MITLVASLMVASLSPVAAESYKDVKITPQTEVKMHFYDVSAATGEDLQQRLLRTAPTGNPGRRAIGKAIYQLSWQLDMNQQSDSCQLYGVKVTTKVDLTMPNWLQLSSLAAETQSSWNGFLSAMQEYEGRHKSIVQIAAKEIGDGVASLPVNSSCQVLRAQADAIGYQALDAAREQARRYQSETGGGRLMGVSYPRL
jgi:predicted secreted Zn-dependent protease